MVYFKDITVDKQDFLVILNDKEQPLDQGTHLKVYRPLTGRYSNSWPKFTNPLHKPTWTEQVHVTKTSKAWTLGSAHHQPSREIDSLLTLGRRIIEGTAKWGDNTKFLGEFHYFKGYWEWTEDVLSRCKSVLRCSGVYDAVYASLYTYDRSLEMIKAFCESWSPATNTLVTSLGELSISLWDLDVLSGLPTLGVLYDEVVPCLKELDSVDRGKLNIPTSCKHLLHAYHLIGNKDGNDPSCSVTIEEWIKFWSKKNARYLVPPPRKERKTIRPKSNSNSSGEIKDHEPWTTMEKSLFAKLGVKEQHWDETYLAAYLVCWLCTFVLPDGDASLIRPTTFKMASLMAYRQRVSLTVPILASVFRGLNHFLRSSEPSRLRAAFPIHFVYAWMSFYFKTHFPLKIHPFGPKMVQFSGEGGARHYDSADARKKILKWDQIPWNCTMFTKNKDIMYVDNDMANEYELCFFIAIRSQYLTRRKDDCFTVEPYSPHRFSRQFGYYQTLSGTLTRDIRKTSLDSGLKYWRACVLRRSGLKICFPCLTSNAQKFSSDEYKHWWEQVYKRSLEENIMVPTASQEKNIYVEQVSDEEALPSKAKRPAVPILPEDTISSSKERHWKKQRVTKSPSSVEDHLQISDLQVDDDVLSGDEKTSSRGSYALSEPNQEDELLVDVEDNVSHSPCVKAVSEFHSDSLIEDALKSFLQTVWHGLRDKILRTPIDSLSSIEEEIKLGLSRMKGHMKGYESNFDLSCVEASLGTLFAHASTYDQARSKSREIGENSAQKVREAKDYLRALRLREKGVTKIRPIKQELVDMERRKSELTTSLKEQESSLQVIRNEIQEYKQKVDKFKNTPLIDDEVLENLKSSQLLLESAHKALEDQNPFA